VKSFEFETWDDGRLVVNREFAPLLRAHGLATFDALYHLKHQRPVRDQDRRQTAPLRLDGSSGPPTFFIKKHDRPAWKEYVKPLLRLTRPTLGARTEWGAIIRFHELGIPTMTPAALGESGGRSFLLTQALVGFQKLSDWLDTRLANDESEEIRTALEIVANLTRTMHAAGLHHQDYYLCHLLVPEPSGVAGMHIIDLGRARSQERLSRRWIIKDLAQLDYSSSSLSGRSRLRFLREYLQRPFCPEDRPLVRQIRRKSRSIAAHSRKHQL
jgi:heptose I phosphotransferase